MPTIAAATSANNKAAMRIVARPLRDAPAPVPITVRSRPCQQERAKRCAAVGLDRRQNSVRNRAIILRDVLAAALPAALITHHGALDGVPGKWGSRLREAVLPAESGRQTGE